MSEAIWHGTTILSVRKGGQVVIAGDGQVSMGNTIVKANARKVRRLGKGDTIILDKLSHASLIDAARLSGAALRVFPHNLWYFTFGRHTGFAIYFFPGALAVLLFLWATRDRAIWQWMTFLAAVGSAVALLLYMP